MSPQARQARHTLRALNGVLVLFGVVLVAIFAQSWRGRQGLVDQARQGCHRSSLDRVVYVNLLRADEEANLAVAVDRFQPLSLRRARYREALIERSDLLSLDRRIDRGDIPMLNPIGQRVVRGLGSRAFSCSKAFPDASPFQFLG